MTNISMKVLGRLGHLSLRKVESVVTSCFASDSRRRLDL